MRHQMERVDFGGEALGLDVAASTGTGTARADSAAAPDQAAAPVAVGDINQANFPTAPSATRTEVAITTEAGTFVMELFEDTPLSRQKFIDNIVAGVYDGPGTGNGSAFVHRRESDFVLQGGNYYITTGNQVGQITGVATVASEAGRHGNVINSVAFALAGGDVNSATTGWYVNLRDNASLLASYTVFGQLVGTRDGLDAMVALPTVNISGSLGAAFTTVPVLHNATTTVTPNDLLRNIYDILGVAAADSGTTGNAAVLNGTSLFANDVDLDTPTLAIAAVNGVSYTAGAMLTLASGAQLTINTDGTYLYNPNHAYDSLSGIAGVVSASALDSFTYTLRGGHLVTGTATVSIAITGQASSDGYAHGSAGNDVLGGGGAANLYLMQQGGNDSVTAGAGDDGIYFGGAYTSGDTVDGGAGGLDQIGLQGNYAGGFTLGGISGVELIVMLSGNDTRFGESGANRYSYSLATTDANVAAGGTLAIQANGLLAGETLNFDGHLERDGSFLVYGGAGDDNILGGAQADRLFGGAGSDTITGGGGADQLTGALGNDNFVYAGVSDSTVAAPDRILDFTSGDHIDLSAVDGNALVSGTQGFTLITGSSFTAPGQLSVTNVGGNDWAVQGDTDGNGSADFAILVTTGDGHALSAADFTGLAAASGSDLSGAQHMVTLTPVPDFIF